MYLAQTKRLEVSRGGFIKGRDKGQAFETVQPRGFVLPKVVNRVGHERFSLNILAGKPCQLRLYLALLAFEA